MNQQDTAVAFEVVREKFFLEEQNPITAIGAYSENPTALEKGHFEFLYNN
ncbi:MAG: hypothetical protein ACI9AR_000144 [Flavobacteriaceae bacterium]|jgi:hypothetical protein